MRPNLSLENIATVIAALGTSAVLAACTKTAEPASVHADQPATQASAASPPPPPPPTSMATTMGDQDTTLKKNAGGSPSASAVTPTPMQPGKPKGTTGQASCGAGTCTADPKKK
jgi:hypothetical protein